MWPNMAGLPMSQSGLRGPKWSQINNITCFWSLLAIWGLLDSFASFQTTFGFLLQITLSKKPLGLLRQKIKFWLKSSKRVQMAPNDQKHVILIIWDHFGPSSITLRHRQACYVCSFLAQKGPFWTPLGTWLRDGNVQNRFKPTSYMSKDYACATDSQSKHIYGRDNQKSDGKGLKMAKNGKILAKITL